MNYSTAVMLINQSIRAVQGQYEQNGSYAVFKTIDQNLKVDDFAVVESGTRWGITTVKITAADVDVDFDSSTQIGWVLHKVDMAQHEEIKKMEADAIEMLRKGELRKRRQDIRSNTLDAMSAGEIDKLDIAKLGGNAIEHKASE